MPAFPHFGEFFGVAVGAHCRLNVGPVDFLAVQRALALAVGRVQLGRDLVQFGGRALGGWRGQHDAAAQLVELAPGDRVETLDIIEAGGVQRRLHRHGRALGTDLGRQRVGIVGDIGRVDPVDARGVDRIVVQLLFGFLDEGAGILRRRRRLLHRVLIMMLGPGGGGEGHGGDCDDRSGGFHTIILMIVILVRIETLSGAGQVRVSRHRQIRAKTIAAVPAIQATTLTGRASAAVPASMSLPCSRTSWTSWQTVSR